MAGRTARILSLMKITLKTGMVPFFSQEDRHMNKNDVIDAIKNKTGLTKEDAKKALDAFTDIVAEALKNGDKVQLIGFGSFEVTERSARTGRNPQTGAAIEIPASKAPRFKAGKALKDIVNS